MDLTGQTFIRGIEIANGRFIVTTQDPGLDIEEQPHSGFCYWSEAEGWVEIGLAPKITLDATTNEIGTRMLKMDPTGFIHEADGDNVSKEFLKDADGNIPSAPFRCVRRVGAQVFAAGVDRQVHRRTEGEWEIISPDGDPDQPTAFQGIDGFGPTEVYAAGWHGEIWSFGGTSWQQINSPSEIILNDICAGPDTCVAVGLAGEVLTGRHNEWRKLSHDAT
ncbi:MAG: hypothetical protein AB8H79_17100, partial [Myxococcota bacterium]